MEKGQDDGTGRIFYVMGKSASGKDTVYRRLLAECPWLSPALLHTTRPMRDGEVQGKDYYFVSREELQAFADAGKVIEQRDYHTRAGLWSYATVDDGVLGRGGKDFLATGTLESYMKIRGRFGEDAVVPIYIKTEDGVRLERALMRERTQANPNYAEMCRRFLFDDADFSQENLKACGITVSYENDNLERCIEEIKKSCLKR